MLAIQSTVTRGLRAIHRRLVPEDPEIGWTPYLWLLYLLFFFLEWFYRPVPPLEIAISIPAVALFLVLYFLGFWVRGNADLWIAAGMTGLGLATAPFNSGAMVFFIFAVAAVATLPERRKALTAMGVIIAILLASAPLLQPSPVYWAVGGLICLSVGAANLFHARRFRETRELALNQAEIRQLAQMRERERIARDLHDQLGQSLSLLTLKAQLARALVRRDPEAAERELREMEDNARQALEGMRGTVRGYRQVDLAAELASARLGLASADIDFDYDPPPRDLPANAEQTMALVLREAVTNVIRHSSATRFQVSFHRQGNFLESRLRDNGRVKSLSEGQGLNGMRERLAAQGGELRVTTGDGLCLSARLPLKDDPGAALENTG